MRSLRRCCSLAGFLLLWNAGCCAALPEAVRARLAAAAPPPSSRSMLVVEIESAALTGVFDGVLLVLGGPSPRVRLQLWPELGAPVLDVVAAPARITGRFAGEPTPRTWTGTPDDPPLHLLLLMGITLLEQHAGLEPASIDCWREGSPPLLAHRGRFPGVAVTAARLSTADRVDARTYHYRGAVWRDRLDADCGEVFAPGVTVRGRRTAFEVDPAISADLFELRPAAGE